IFAVDASGSAAVERLAETKGAIELLLAECYVRRDSVALIAFRGGEAETLLEPTRSLVRAKRSLQALPGGGGTPLASGILAALEMARISVLKGQSVVTVFLTDGRGNIGLDGSILRERVAEDTTRTARLFRASGQRSILIDTAQRPQARAASLAAELGAEYLPLPRGGARRLSREIGARMENEGNGFRA
ncbi:MAG: VWA domain-containing protein, partial [Mesorhizobium sp.]|nr:VWA domain-containing protein [Mesorhizobium sp.]